MEANVESILKRVSEDYDIKGTLVEFEHCPNGHINGTYRVKFCSGNNPNTDSNMYDEYIFQKINDYVFKEPLKVMHNIKEITQYLKSRKKECDCDIRTFLNTKNNENYTVCNGGYWRVCAFVKNSVAYEYTEEPKVLYSAGYAFGRFQYLLSGFPMEKLYETIPDFHNTKKRLKDFFDMVKLDPMDRAKNVEKEIRFFEDHKDIACKLIDMLDKGELPLRVTHNDTKYNNILLDKDTIEPLCVIDLDTVMPGLSMYDFGDAIRFAANTAMEDETDLSKVRLNMESYREFTRGFTNASKEFLNKNEIDYMALGAIVITIELASRFLADYLNGDKYFRIHRENHNLERARCQIRLAEDMIDKYDEMCRIVQEYCK